MLLELETPTRRREDAFLEAVQRSRRLHGRWVSPPSSREAYRQFVARQEDERLESYLLILPESDEIGGVVNVSEIVRGAFWSAYLGYYSFEPHANRGVMTRGLELVVTHSFREIGLHRVEANIQPENRSSIRLVRKLGFRREGYSPRYLQIDGRWCDHERWAVLSEDWLLRRRARGLAATAKS